ncbi:MULTISPECIES: sodium-dependent transporter [unclassified Prevotella]|uniref:sodium-dependent transporter n=1 Tax=unclassified Prevotella TaxID=2638335 RepID=UPI000CE9BA18|nr:MULTISPECIES: sodium-dependent transporter [unclassified Prevotella]MCX4292785.1 sodium-dependent transporter [Prevotella sp.]NPD54938.1 sodium-dependent transporter [Prevotella sp. PTAC]GAY28765.1 neurotransmitter:Na+ symporter, NSS family [Prevotella sp. MGM1]
MAQLERAKFGSKLGIILATAGSAVGLGNVWRFPYMAGENGGAVFIIMYLGCVLLLGIPCMVSEFIIGRHGQSNTARAYGKLAGKSLWRFVGYMGVLTGFLITGYYAVVSGWCLQYIYASLLGRLQGDTQYIKDYFVAFEQDPVKPIFWMVMFLFVTHFVISHGVRDGIERASKALMPTLFILLLFIVGASCTLPGAEAGIAFLFKPDLAKLNADVFFSALGQAFYSLSIAMGCVCTYASYFSRHTDLPRSAIQIGIIDSMVAILAGLMIFPAAFSVGVNPDSGPSLIFITLPNVFHQAFAAMPAVGYVVSLLFYGLLALAALTSLISLHEVSTAFFHEEFHISRRQAALFVTMACSVIGVFCSLSLGRFDGLQLFGMPLFELFDFVTGQIFLPVGGFLTCLFVGWFVPHKIVRDEYTNNGTLRTRFFHLYLFCVKYVCPVCIVIIFLNQFGLI